MEIDKAFALKVEKDTWFPNGRNSDGSVYTCLIRYWLWLDNMIRHLGGINKIITLIKTRKNNGEALADSSCANWWLWTVLNELGVSRVKK